MEEELNFNKPWDRNNALAMVLNNNQYALADFIQVRVDALSAGDRNVMRVKSYYKSKGDEGKFDTVPYYKAILVWPEITSIQRGVEDNGCKRGEIHVSNIDASVSYTEVKDVSQYKEKNATVFSNDTFFKPVYWIPITKELLNGASERISRMGEHISLFVWKSGGDKTVESRYMKLKNVMEKDDLGIAKLYELIELGEMYVMSEPESSLSKTKESGGYGEGIPNMPGETGNVQVRKPSTGGDSDGKGESYSSLGSNWWGSND